MNIILMIMGYIISSIGKFIGEMRFIKKQKKQNEEYKEKILGFHGSLIFYKIAHKKLLVIYYIVLTVFAFTILLISISIDKEVGNFLAMIGFIIAFVGLILGLIIMLLCTKKLKAIYTKHYLFLDFPKSDYNEKIVFSEIEKVFYKKKTLTFIDKYGKSIEIDISSGIYGLHEFIPFLHKKYGDILKLMPKGDKEKYNKFIEKMIDYSALYSEECLL